MKQHNSTTAVVTRTGATPNAPTRVTASGIVTVTLLLGLTAGALSGCILAPAGYCGPGPGYGPPGPRSYYRY